MKAFIRIVLLFASVIVSGCREEEVQSSWVSSQPSIDGNLQDWEHSRFLVVEEDRLVVSVANDSTYLYLAARISDVGLLRRVERVGLSLWIDPEGGDNDDLQVYVPPAWLSEAYGLRGGFWESLTEEQRARAQRQLEEMRNGILVVDKRNVDSRVFPIDSKDGFGARTARATGLMTFEVRIPRKIQDYFSKYVALGTKGKVGLGIRFDRALGRDFARSPDQTGTPTGPVGRRGRGGGGGGVMRPRVPQQSGQEMPDVLLKVTLALPG